MDENNPMVTIKLKFEELPNDIKHEINLLVGLGITCLFLLNIMLFSKMLYFYCSKIKSNSRIINYDWV